MRKVYAIIFLVLANLVFSQDVRQGLIVVHVDPNGRSEFKQKIYTYHFLNGSYVGREELLAVAGKKDGKDYIRTDLGTNLLYKDRYLITGIGNVIDLKEKKVLWDGRANLVRLRNDSAVYYTNDAFKGKYYSVFNFKTNQYGEVKNLVFKAKLGQDVEFDKTTTPFKLFLYPANKPKIELVSNAGYGQQGTKESRTPDPMMWWIDNTNFVYANFNKECTEVTFYKVNANTKASSVVGKVSVKPEPVPATLTKIDEGRAIMNYGSKQIYIDVDVEMVNDLIFSNPSNGFSFEIKTNPYGHIIKYNDKDVAKAHFQAKNFKTEKNIAAVVKELVMGTESYQQGLGVWDNNKQALKTVDAEEVLTLVGFVNE
ncbi:MAG: hypothetical protein IPM51_11220 [Sphingobacteriaceae bacterium]|nr:hypothetical protein [Sphingobacteriaceae bacterium]